MPKFRNLFDYSTEEAKHRPKESVIDVPVNDTVKAITLYFEDSGYVQISRLPDSTNDWRVITSFEITKQKKWEGPHGR